MPAEHDCALFRRVSVRKLRSAVRQGKAVGVWSFASAPSAWARRVPNYRTIRPSFTGLAQSDAWLVTVRKLHPSRLKSLPDYDQRGTALLALSGLK